MSFQIEQHINNEKNIHFNYYNTYAKRVFSPKSSYQFLYQGRENTPNLIINEGSHNVNYISSNFFIFSKIHKINGIDFDGELVIENTPITNFNKKIYVCIPLKTVTQYQDDNKSNIIDFILQHTESNSNIEVNFDEILPVQDKCIYYNDNENQDVLLFTTPILVQSKFNKISYDNNLFSQTNNSVYQIIKAMKANHHIENTIENTHNSSPIFVVKPKLQQQWEELKKKVNNAMVFILSGKLFETFDEESQKREKERKINLLIKKIKQSQTPDSWDIKNKIENFVEGITMQDDNDEWMECDNVPIDYSDEIPTYTVNARSKTTDMNSNLLMKTLQIFWILFSVILMYVMIPLVYGFLAVRSIMKINIADVKERHAQITGLEMALSFLIVFPSIVLLLYGFNNSTLDSKGAWMFGNQHIINCVVSGGLLFFIWFISVVIIYIKKIQDANFLGYENGNLRTPYFTFGEKTDYYAGLNHIFTSIVALFK